MVFNMNTKSRLARELVDNYINTLDAQANTSEQQFMMQLNQVFASDVKAYITLGEQSWSFENAQTLITHVSQTGSAFTQAKHTLAQPLQRQVTCDGKQYILSRYQFSSKHTMAEAEIAFKGVYRFVMADTESEKLQIVRLKIDLILDT